MSVGAPEAGGGMDVGSIFARVGAVFDGRAWDLQARAVAEARRQADRPIEQPLRTRADESGWSRWTTRIKAARDEAARPVTQTTHVRVDEQGFNTLHRHLGQTHEGFRTFEKDAEGFVGKLSGLGFGLARFSGGVVALLASLGGVEVIKRGTERLGEMERTAAITTQRLKSTGDAAHVTAKQVDELANATFRKTGIDHEAVAQAENLLLAYTHVRNEVGKNRDIFNQATRAVADLSVGTGRDMTTSARALGMALDNPEKGLTRLTRAGIMFSDQQKAQIKQMEESGNLLGAQRLILGEVEKRYGGAADAVGKTMPAALARAKVAWQDTTAQLAKEAAPTIISVANGLEHLLTQVKNNTGPGKVLRDVFSEVGAAIRFVVDEGKDLVGFLTSNTKAAREARGVIVALTAGLIGFNVLKDVKGLIVDVTGAWKLLAAAFEASPFGVVLAGAALVVLALQSMGVKFQSVGQYISAIWRIIKDDVGTVVDLVRGWLREHSEQLDAMGRHLSSLGRAFADAAVAVAKFVAGTHILNAVVDVLKALAGAALDVVGWILKLVDSRGGLIALAAAAGLVTAAVTPLIAALAAEKVTKFAGSVLTLAGNLRQAAGEAVKLARASITGDLPGARTAAGNIRTALGGGGAAAAVERAAYQLTGIRGAGVGSEANPLVVTVMGGQMAGLGSAAAEAEAGTAGEAGALGAARRGGGQTFGQGGIFPAAAGSTEAAVVAEENAGLMRGLGGRLMGGLGIAGIGLGASQIAGSAIGGKAGSTVATVGSLASAGAGLGMLFGPEGAIAGGIGGAIVGGLTRLFSDNGPTWGQAIAKGISTGGFGRGTDTGKVVSDALDAYRKATTQTRTVAGPRGSQIQEQVHLDLSQITDPKAYNEAFNAAFRAGHAVAQQLEAGWNQYRFQDEPTMFVQLRGKLKNLPPAAQAAGVESAVNFARGLEAQGRLPAGSVAKMIKQAEDQFPGFTRYLGIQGDASARAFTDALDFRQAERNLSGTLKRVGDDFGAVAQAMSDAGGSIDDKSAAAITALRKIASSGSGPASRAAASDLEMLRQQASTALDKLAAKTDSTVADISKQLGPNTAAATKAADIQLGNFSANVITNMEAGATGTGQAMSIIIDTLNKALKEMGQKQLSPIQVGAIKLNVGKQQQLVNRNAQGGAYQFGSPGAKGTDSIGLNFGGHDIVVGDGEMGLVLTGDQQQEVVGSLMDRGYRSLDDFFARRNRPHYMAAGGPVANTWPKSTAQWDAHHGYSRWASWMLHPEDHGTVEGRRPYHLGDPMGTGEFDQSIEAWFSRVWGRPVRSLSNIPRDATDTWHGEWAQHRRRYAQGGFVADPGTNFSYGEEPQIATRLNALGRAIGQTIYGISGYRSPQHSVAVGGFSNDPHTQGRAADIGVGSQMRSSAAQLTRATLARFGLDRPFDESGDPNNPEVNHVQLLLGSSFAGGASSPGMPISALQKINAPRVQGDNVLAHLARAAGQIGARGANAYEVAHSPAGGGGTGGAPFSAGGSGTISTARFNTLVEDALGILGIKGSHPAWIAMLDRQASRESSFRINPPPPHDINWPNNPSMGLLQVTEGTFREYAAPGHNTSITDPLSNILASIRYIIGRYGHGNPDIGLNFMIANAGNAYARGGRVTRTPPPRPAPTVVHADVARPKNQTSHHVNVTNHTKGGRQASDSLLRELTHGDKRLHEDLVNYNAQSQLIDDLGSRFSRTQNEQQIADKRYGNQVPQDVLDQQANALIAIKQQVARALGTENKAAQRVQTYLNEWVPNRTTAEAKAARAVKGDQALINQLTAQLTGVERSGAAAKSRQTRERQVTGLKNRLTRLQASHAKAVANAHKTKGARPPRYDPYGNKLPAEPSTDAGRTVASNQQEIDQVNQQLQALQRAPVQDPATVQKQKLQDAIKRARSKLTGDRAADADLKKELTALTQVQQIIGGAADKDTGIPGQIRDNQDDIATIKGNLPGGAGGSDWSALPPDQQRALDEVNSQLAAAESETPGVGQYTDQSSALQRLVGFWKLRVAYLQQRHAPSAAVADARAQEASAEQQLQGLDQAGAFEILPGNEQTTLDQLNYQLAQAEGLPAGQQAGAETPVYQNIVSFWTNRLAELTGEGAPVTALTDAQQNLNAALSNLSSAQSSTTPDQQAIISQQATQIQNLQALNRSAAASLSAFGGPADIGSGGYRTAYGAAAGNPAYGAATPSHAETASAFAGGPSDPNRAAVPTNVSSAAGYGGGGQPNVTVIAQSLHPADPGILHQIGNTVVNAFNNQPFATASGQKML